jgi:transcriptional regulator with XRE-family HTH domain
MARKLPIPDPALSPRIKSLDDLGRLVRNARAHGGLRIDDTAHLAGVSSDLLSRLENGKPVTTDKLLALLDTLGLSLLVLPHTEATRLLKRAALDNSEAQRDGDDQG